MFLSFIGYCIPLVFIFFKFFLFFKKNIFCSPESTIGELPYLANKNTGLVKFEYSDKQGILFLKSRLVPCSIGTYTKNYSLFN